MRAEVKCALAVMMLLITGCESSSALAQFSSQKVTFDGEEIVLPVNDEYPHCGKNMNSASENSSGVNNLTKCRHKYVECMQNYQWAHHFEAGKSRCQRWYEICLSQGYWPGY